jgi:hypothetical protein
MGDEWNWFGIMRFEVLAANSVKIMVFWNVKQFSLLHKVSSSQLSNSATIWSTPVLFINVTSLLLTAM